MQQPSLAPAPQGPHQKGSVESASMSTGKQSNGKKRKHSVQANTAPPPAPSTTMPYPGLYADSQLGADSQWNDEFRNSLLTQLQQQTASAASNSMDAFKSSNTTTSQDQAMQLDPAIASPSKPTMVVNQGMSNEPTEGSASDGQGEANYKSGGKRPLSQSKRAAQNRAAQRAFRHRKEAHIKTLQDQVASLATLQANFRAVTSENYSLREYIINLQSRLIETQGDVPPLPPNISLSHAQNHNLEAASAQQQSKSHALEVEAIQAQPKVTEAATSTPTNTKAIATALLGGDAAESAVDGKRGGRAKGQSKSPENKKAKVDDAQVSATDPQLGGISA